MQNVVVFCNLYNGIQKQENRGGVSLGANEISYMLRKEQDRK